jgi:putative ABC transport system permease protein
MRSLSERLFTIVLPPSDRKHILDELEELYQVQLQKVGEKAAEGWRRKQIWSFVVRALPTFWWRRPLSGFLRVMAQRDGRLSFWDTLGQDLRFAFRSFRRKPGFALAAILILGVGIGSTTAIFSVVDTVMIRPLPYPEPGKLVHFGGYAGMRPSMYTRWRDGLGSYESLGAAWNFHVNLTEDGPPKRLQTSRITEAVFPLLGATPHLGRLLMRDDYGGDFGVGVLGYGFWQRQWGGDPAIVGQQIRVEGRPVVVAGILSPDFDPPEAITGAQVDLWLPFDVDAAEISTWSILSVVGRLKKDVGLLAARSELRTFTTNLAEELPGDLVRQDGSIRHTRLVPLQISTFQGVGSSLIFLLWAVLLMLAIACANVANLLLAQGNARVREMALRGALGAGRRRIVKQLLTESMALSVMGGMLGVGLAFFGVKVFLRFNPGGVPRIEELAVDPRILLFALMASLVTGLIFGLSPALTASRKDVAEAIKEGGAASAGVHWGRWTRRGLVVTEIALALVLLTGAGLFFRSLLSMAEVDPGFKTEQMVMVPLHLGSDYVAAKRQQFTKDVATRLGALPGTEGVAAGLTAPFQFVGANKCCIWHPVEEPGGAEGIEALPMVMTQPISPEYFKTIDAPITYGREFNPSDEAGDGFVAIINEPTARYFFGTDNAVGRNLDVGEWGTFTVVGVARGVRHWGVAQGIPSAVYVPYAQWGAFSDFYTLMVRSTADSETLASMIRDAIWAFDPGLPVEEIVPMRQRVEASMAGQRFLSILLGTFATIALILATGGIYATMLQTVGQRRQEMGIRMALGAKGGQVIGLVLKGGVGLTAVGIGIGIIVSLGLTQVLRFWLFGIGVIDPVTLAGVVLVLWTGAFLACLIPAMKAARADPLETLKVE